MKTIHHTWNELFGTGKLKHANCPTCHCEKYYDERLGQLIFIDRFGKLHLRTPACVMPNTKL
jgi:hypothetical protein